MEVKTGGETWIVTQPSIQIKEDKASLFSPGLRSCYDVPELLDIFKTYCCEGYSLRHSGAMGPDCYQILLKGQGLYSKYDSVTHPSNLRLLYEILPMAFLIEKAGGKSDDGSGSSVLELKIKGYEQRGSLLAGSAFEVDRMRSQAPVEV